MKEDEDSFDRIVVILRPKERIANRIIGERRKQVIGRLQQKKIHTFYYLRVNFYS